MGQLSYNRTFIGGYIYLIDRGYIPAQIMGGNKYDAINVLRCIRIESTSKQDGCYR
ncbi:protein of unknown function [[Clostridium] ultunense Esp]|uniref:Uncharacterized protein n=1 Tax=[Clostridium] ultunense Esp TaxID=1288971 RepID=A0A1M4PNJ0_9FIRM|nr:protein of unknown function [[Clostridium] ultunense Esp]